MTFSYNAVWEDAMRLLRRHAPLLAAIAGVFVFLPALLVNHFFPKPQPPLSDFQEYVRIMLQYFRDHSLWLVLESFVAMVGTAAMLRLVLAARTTVGAAIVFGIALLPVYSILVVVANLVVIVGLILFIAPGLYLWGRLFPASAAMVAENLRSPVAALRRSVVITKGHGWAVVGLYLIVNLCGLVLISAIHALVGILFIAVAGQHFGGLLAMILGCALAAALVTLLTMLSAAVYRALTTSIAKG